MRKTGLIATLLLMCTFIFSANAAETWVKVTEAPESWEGDYLIVSGDYAFDGSFVAEFGNYLKDIPNSKEFVSTGDVYLEDNCDYYFKIREDGYGKYSVESASGYYIGGTNPIRSVSSGYNKVYGHEISVNADGTVELAVGTVSLRYSEYNNNFDYKAAGNPIQLYKRFVSALAAPLITGVSNGGLYFGSVSISILTEDEDATVSYMVTKDGKFYDSGNGEAQFKLDFSEQGKYVVETFAERGGEESEYQRVVFTVISAGLNEVWVKVTEEPESWEGDYLIVSGDYAFDGSFVAEFGNYLKDIPNSKEFVSTGDVYLEDNCDYYFKIREDGYGKYSVESASGYYIGGTNPIRSVSSGYNKVYGHEISVNADGTVELAVGTVSLRYSEYNNKFNYQTGGNPVQLYRHYVKPVESSATEVSGIAELKDAGAAAEAGTVFEMNCPLTATFSNGDDLYVIDDSGDALLIKGSIGKTYASGEVIPAGAQGCYELIDGFTPAMVNPVGNTFGEPQAMVEVTPISVDEITVSDVNKYVKVEDVMVNSTDSGSYVFMASDDGNEIPGWSDAENPYYNGTVSSGDGLSYDVSGIVVVKEGSAALAFTNLEKRIESGVDDLVTGNVMIAGGKCRVIINVPDGNVVRACVYSVSGILLNEEAVTGVSEIELPSGLYIVRIGNQVAKVVVR